MTEKTTLKKTCQAFHVGPSYLWVLEARNALPKRPRGIITLEYLEALAQWYQTSRGELPTEAQEILDTARLEHEHA